MGSQALGHLLDTFLHLSLLYQCPATQDNTTRPPLRKPLFRGKADGGFGAFLGDTHLATELMQFRHPTEGDTQAKGMRQLLREGQRLVAPQPSLVRIAQIPQGPTSMAQTNHTRILPIAERRSAVLLGIIERYPLGNVRVRRGNRTQVE